MGTMDWLNLKIQPLVASLPVALGVAGGTQLALSGQFTSPWLRKLAAFVTETGV